MHLASYNTESMNQTDLLDYISGTDKSGEKEIEAWLRESPENREQYFLMKELWAHKVAREVSGEERLDKAISGIHSKIQNERMRSRYRRSAAIGWSFASCLLLFIALWTGIPKLGKKPDIVLENINEAVSLHSLPDGSRAFLRKGASLSYDNDFNSGSRTVSLVGEAYFDVTRDEASPFVVLTPHTKVKVLGTSFNVRSGDNTQVVLEKGKVALCDSEDRQVAELLPGNMATVSDGGRITLSAVQTSDYTKWRYNYRIYESCSFDDFVFMAEDRFGVRFVYDPSKFRDTYFRLAISDSDTLEDILSMMEYIAHLKYEQKDKIIYITSKQ